MAPDSPLSYTWLQHSYYSWMVLTREKVENISSKQIDVVVVVGLYHVDMQF